MKLTTFAALVLPLCLGIAGCRSVYTEPAPPAPSGCGTEFDFGPSGLPPGFGFGDWELTMERSRSGATSLQSGDIGDGGVSRATWNFFVQNPSTFSVWGSASTESCCDHLIVRLDGEELGRVSGSAGFEEITGDVSAGAHLVEFVYQKDSSVSNERDAVWIDDIRIEPNDPAACLDAGAVRRDSGPFVRTDGGPRDAGSALNVATCAELREESPQSQDGEYTLTLEGPGGSQPHRVFCEMEAGGFTTILSPLVPESGVILQSASDVCVPNESLDLADDRLVAQPLSGSNTFTGVTGIGRLNGDFEITVRLSRFAGSAGVWLEDTDAFEPDSFRMRSFTGNDLQTNACGNNPRQLFGVYADSVAVYARRDNDSSAFGFEPTEDVVIGRRDGRVYLRVDGSPSESQLGTSHFGPLRPVFWVQGTDTSERPFVEVVSIRLSPPDP